MKIYLDLLDLQSSCLSEKRAGPLLLSPFR
jgi:hypothetical protein